MNRLTACCIALLPLTADAFAAVGTRHPTPTITRATIVAQDDKFDPFTAPRGPPLKKEELPPPAAAAATASTEERDPTTVLGARVLGAGVGGLAGNKLWTGLLKVGLTTCSPFDLEGCNDAALNRAAAPTQAAAPKPTGVDDMNFPFADVLRNPTSILPQEWTNLPGRKYLSDVDMEEDLKALPQLDVPQISLPQLQVPGFSSSTPSAPPEAPVAVPTTPPPLPTPTLPPPTTTTATPDAEELARLKERLAQLQGQMTSSAENVLGVPPASASDAPLPGADALQVFDPHHTHALVSLPTTLIADGGGDAISTLLVTVLFAGIGALGFEYMATNKASPVPDPMFSGVYLTLQGVVASASKATGQAAEVVVKQVKDKLPI